MTCQSLVDIVNGSLLFHIGFSFLELQERLHLPPFFKLLCVSFIIKMTNCLLRRSISGLKLLLEMALWTKIWSSKTTFTSIIALIVTCAIMSSCFLKAILHSWNCIVTHLSCFHDNCLWDISRPLVIKLCNYIIGKLSKEPLVFSLDLDKNHYCLLVIGFTGSQ